MTRRDLAIRMYQEFDQTPGTAIDGMMAALRIAEAELLPIRKGGRSELVEIVSDEIVVRISIDALPESAALAWKGRSLRELEVTNKYVFASELISELRREKETGDTLVTDMLYSAVIRAIENGAEGFDLKDPIL